MRRIRPFLAHAAALAAVFGITVLPVLTPATPASATATCGGTSLVLSGITSQLMRVPTVGNGTPSQFDCMMGPGDTSAAVSRLQLDLNDCQGDHLSVDGIYGPKTEAAVKSFQALVGITRDGIYGPHTVDHFAYQISGAATGDCGGIAGA